MHGRNLSRLAALLAAGCSLISGGLLAGCKGDAQFSQKEMQQIKEGPPKEMPPEARAVMNKAKGPGGGGAPATGTR